MGERGDGEKVTIGSAIRDLGFVSGLFMALVGAPSVISLTQTLLTDFRLSTLLQWIIDGYNDLLKTLSLGLEPVLRAVLEAARDLLALDVTLHPYWRPLFVLALIFISANTRTLWGDGKRAAAVIFAAFCALSALIGSVIAGAVPAEAAAWEHAATAALFVFLLFFGMFGAYALATPLFDFRQPYRKPLRAYLRRGIVFGAAAFAAAYALSLLDFAIQRSGLLTIFAGMLLYGAYWLYYGWREADAPEIRFGLRLVGGFVFAGAIIALDQLIR